MADFIPGTDSTVAAAEPQLNVQVGPNAPLRPGKHVFQLVVQDDSGNNSQAATVTIIVLDEDVPTAVIDQILPTGARDPSPEIKVKFGEGFVLTGDRSSDVGGEVKQWTWTLLQA